MPKVLVYFSAIMSLAYVFIGIFFAFSSTVGAIITYPYNIFLGIVLIGYGLFRVYRFYHLLVKSKND